MKREGKPLLLQAVRLLAHVERCEAVWRLHGRDLGCERVLASDLLLKQVGLVSEFASFFVTAHTCEHPASLG